MFLGLIAASITMLNLVAGIENQETQIAPQDEIEIKGSRITFEGKPAVIGRAQKG